MAIEATIEGWSGCAAAKSVAERPLSDVAGEQITEPLGQWKAAGLFKTQKHGTWVGFEEYIIPVGGQAEVDPSPYQV